MRGVNCLVSIFLLASTADARFRRSTDDPKSYYPDREAKTKCEELCEKDNGHDADDCRVECAVSTDLNTHHLEDGYKHFVNDEAYNEKGGNKIKEHADENLGVDAAACVPQVCIDRPPKLEELDANEDGVIDQDEVRAWGHAACVTDEMVDQIFSQADTNQDGVITAKEYKGAGENTEHEVAVDKALEKHSEGDDEYNQVQAPPLREFDENDDGALDKKEHKDAVKLEMERRGEGRWSVSDDEIPKDALDDSFDKVDADDNGKIEGDEYEKSAPEGGLGDEIVEAAKADEDAEDPDDLSDDPDTKPAAMLLSTRFKKAQSDEAVFLHRFAPEPKHFGHALAQVASKHQLQSKKAVPRRRFEFRNGQ